METMNIFEIATRNKYRFSYKGMIGVEDLWDLSVTALDSIFKGLKAQEKQSNEESLLDTPTNEDVETSTKIAIIRHIVQVKQKEAADRKNAKAKAEQKRKIREIIAEKQDQALQNKSIDELTALLAELD